MKKIITDTKSLAALLMAGAALAACSGDDNIVEEQPANPAQHTYTMTIEATKGGDAATTRALALDGKTLNATWQTTDEVAVYNHTQQAVLGGHLSPQSNSASATLTGSLTGSVAVDDIIYLRWPSVDANYTGQDGTLETIAQSYDYTTGIAQVKAISGAAIVAEDSPNGGPVQFTNNQAIVKFTLTDQAGSPIRATQLTIDAKVDGGSRLIQSITYPNAYTLGPITINRTEPTDNVVYAALPFSSQAPSFTFALTATDGTHTYTYEKAGVTMNNGRYYEVKVKMTRETYPIALNGVTSDYIGSVVTTDGTVYATVADAIAANKTAAGMIAYVSGIGQGLVIALADEADMMNWNTAITTAAAHTPAVTGYSWKLPTMEEWKQMFKANDVSETSYAGLNTTINNAGGTILPEGVGCWSSSEDNPGVSAHSVLFNSGYASWTSINEDLVGPVRACLAFGYARGHALASSAVGEIVGSDGLAYYAADKDNLPLGVTAVAMIAYKNIAGESLAIQLNGSSSKMGWSAACSYSSYPSIAGNPGTWRLPSKADWQNMFVGCAKDGDDSDASDNKLDPIAGFKEKIGATGITWHSNSYWSSTDSGSNAWLVLVNLYSSNALAAFVEYDTSDLNLVLGCLAF